MGTYNERISSLILDCFFRSKKYFLVISRETESVGHEGPEIKGESCDEHTGYEY
jgi:hypothetical protein